MSTTAVHNHVKYARLTPALFIAEKFVVFVPAQSRKASARSQKVFKIFVQKKSGPRIEASPDKLKCSCLAVCGSVSIMTSDDDFADEEDFTDALLGEQPKTKFWHTCH